MLLVGRRARRRSEVGAAGIVADRLPDSLDAIGGDWSGQRTRTWPARGFGLRPRTVAAWRHRSAPEAGSLSEAAAVAEAAPVSPAVPAPAGGPPAGPLSIPLLPGERTVARRIKFALVNACTIGSLLLGFVAVMLVVNAADVRWAALCVLGCVVFDGLDGALARRLGVASPFGAQMDSLVDMCSFGVAAPVVVYAWLVDSASPSVLVPACALVAVCAAIRLARFNVSPKDGRFFCGVPTTMAAAVLALGALVSPDLPAELQVAGVALLALAMVSSFPFVKLARLLRLPPWLLVLPGVGALIDYRLTFAAVVFTYLASGPVLWLRQREA